jgi:hypothetical protein
VPVLKRVLHTPHLFHGDGDCNSLVLKIYNCTGLKRNLCVLRHICTKKGLFFIQTVIFCHVLPQHSTYEVSIFVIQKLQFYTVQLRIREMNSYIISEKCFTNAFNTMKC